MTYRCSIAKRVRRNEEISSPKLRVIDAQGHPGRRDHSVSKHCRWRRPPSWIWSSVPADPPVCRIMDFGKFLFEQNKKAHAAKRKQKQIQIKEVKFRPGTEEGDYQVKLRNLIRFLQEGDKAKVTMRFRGREMAHQEVGREPWSRVQNDLAPYAQVEQNPLMEGRQMVMMFGPKKK